MSAFARQPLLTKEEEDELKVKMRYRWKKGMKGKEIAEELGFGEPGIYEKLKPNYIYYYRQKLNLPPRNEPPFPKDSPRYKKQPTKLKEDYGLIDPETFEKTLNAKLPAKSKLFWVKRARAYLILHYWTPLRSSEIYERTIYDFKVTKDKLIIHLLRKKKSTHKDDDEPIYIPRAFPLIDEVIDWFENGEWKEKKVKVTTRSGKEKTVPSDRPFHFGKDTANAYVKEAFPDYYPHYFRYHYITRKASNPKTSIDELVAKTKLTLPALQHYIITDEKTQESLDEREIKNLRDEGLIE
jgi:hypothetical protein